MENVVIIGSGCAGLTAAIYAARANLTPLVLTGVAPGGLLTTTSIVENYPGFPDGVDGYELMTRLQKQAEKFGARVKMSVVDAVDFTKKKFKSIAVKANSTAGGSIQVHLNSATGPVVANVTIPKGQDWKTIKAPVSKLKQGSQNLVVTSGSNNPVEVDWISFE